MRSQSFRPLTALLLGTSLLLAACASIERDKRAVALQAATNGYQSAIRWGYYETAFGYLHPDLRKDKAPPESLKDVRLTGYDVIQPPSIQTDETAIQVVDIEFLFEDRQVVKRLTDRQVWKWDEALDSWWLMSGLPRFQ